MTDLPEPLPPVPDDAEVLALLRRAEGRPVRRPPVLPAIAVGILAMPFAALVVAMVMVVMAVVSMVGSADLDDVERLMRGTAQEPRALFGLLLLQFVALGAVPLAAAHAGRRTEGGVVQSLGLVRPRMKPWLYPFAIVGSFGVMLAAGLLTQLLVNAGLLPQMESLPADLLVDLPTGWKAACLGVMSVGPGVCEELVFRGYVMRRLARRWSPWVAIGLSAMLFGIAHVQPMHMFFAFLMGLWLGWLAWRTRSIVPSIVAHFAVDFTVFGVAAFGGVSRDPRADPGPAALAWSAGLSIIGLAAAAVVVVATRDRAYAGPEPTVLSGQ